MIAYFGEIESKNLGDVAVYTALHECYSLGKQITPITPGSEFTGPSLQQELKQYSSIMIGGGTQFTPMNTIYLKTIFQSNDRVWSFGTGVGSCGFCEHPEPDLLGIACFLSRIHPLTVRGPLSQEALHKYGIHSEVIGDPALGYAKDQIFFRGGKRILVNLVSPEHTYELMEYQRFLSSLASSLRVLRAKGYLIEFLALGPGDYGYIDHFRSTFGFSGSEIAEIYTSVHDFFETLREAAVILSMRLHGAILAACAGVPFLLCDYRPKCRDFTTSIQQNDLLLSPSSSASDIMNSVEYLLGNGHRISGSVRSKALFFRDVQARFIENQSRN